MRVSTVSGVTRIGGIAGAVCAAAKCGNVRVAQATMPARGLRNCFITSSPFTFPTIKERALQALRQMLPVTKFDQSMAGLMIVDTQHDPLCNFGQTAPLTNTVEPEASVGTECP